MAIVIVSGALANKSGNGGEAWVRLSWVLGLQKLGYRVYFIEQIAPQSCRDAAGNQTTFESSENCRYFAEVTSRFGLADTSALIDEESRQTHGLSWSELQDLAANTDLLINISGHLTLAPLFRAVRRKAYIDIDPGFTQFWHAAGNPGAHLEDHDFYFTTGANIGTPACFIPTGGFSWHPIRPPVVLEQWPVAPTQEPDRFTTIASWRGAFGPVEFEGKKFGVKAHEFRKYVDLPRRAAGQFEIALSIHPADAKDLNLLLEHGWDVADPREVAVDPDSFRHYVQNSSAEFSVAQGIYVDTMSGWFSDRTAHYLASGKPALVQDTGFSRDLPNEEGLVAFHTLDEAVASAERIRNDYGRHCRAARAVAEEYFASESVLTPLLELTGVAP